MKTPSDEQIMAWVDGELPEDEARQVERAIQGDPEAQKKAEVFRGSTAMLKAAFDDPLHEAVPEKLIRTIRAHGTPRAAARRTGSWRSFFRIPVLSPAFGVALAVVLLGGLLSGYLFFGTSRSGLFTGVPSGRQFSRGLETIPSGNSFYLADGNLKVTPVATFRDRARRYCRQYEVEILRGAKGQWAQGVACRDRRGDWHTRVYVPPMPQQAATQRADTYVPAAGDDAMTGVLDRLMAGAPLTTEQEAALIRSGWRETGPTP